MAGKNKTESLPVGSSEEDTRKFWRDNARAMLGESIGALEGAAKQIIIVTSLLEGIYFHAIAFSKIKSSLTILSGIIYLAPFLWFLPHRRRGVSYSPYCHHRYRANCIWWFMVVQ